MTNEHKRRHKVTMPRINTLKNTKKYHANKHPKFSDNKWQKFYGSRAWHNLRETKLLEQPICERCYDNGIIRAATDVHHKIPFSTGIDEQQMWELFLDYENLMSLCKQCHIEIHGHHRRD